jgi:DNA recombination protein RmuC
MPTLIVILLIVVVVLLLAVWMKTSKIGSPMLGPRLDAFEKAQERTERAVREEVAQSREELSKAGKEQRQELTEAFKVFGDSFAQRMLEVASVQTAQLDVFSDQLTSFAQLSGESLVGSRAESAASAKLLREEVVVTLNTLSDTMMGTMRERANLLKSQLDAFSEQLASFAQASGEKLDRVRGESAMGAKHLREEVVTTLNSISETMVQDD